MSKSLFAALALLAAIGALSSSVSAQPAAGLTTAESASLAAPDFAPEEFAARRARVMDAMGNQAIAVIQGAADFDGFKLFRQNKTMYYLTGVATATSPPSSTTCGSSRARRKSR